MGDGVRPQREGLVRDDSGDGHGREGNTLDMAAQSFVFAEDTKVAITPTLGVLARSPLSSTSLVP